MSQLGAKLKPVDDPSVLYLQAVDGFFAGLDSDPNVSEVLGQLLLHVDNNVDRLYKLFINIYKCLYKSIQFLFSKFFVRIK